MTTPDLTKNPFIQLQQIVWFQRSSRLVVRALWFGLGTWLIAWSVDALWGWLPSRIVWLACAGCVTIITLAFIPYRKPSLSSLTWKIDRRFGFLEQVSTGYVTTQSDKSNSITSALLADVYKLIIPLTVQIKHKGWQLLPDSLSLLVVVALFFSVYQIEFTQPDIPEYQANLSRYELSPLGEDPQLPDLFRVKDTLTAGENGAGQESPLEGNAQTEGEKSNSLDENSEGQVSSDKYNALTQSLNEFGNFFNQDASGYEIGQDMMSGNLNQTADAIEKLADQLEKMSPETRSEIKDMLQRTGENLTAEGLNSTGDALKKAADSLEKSNASTGKALSQNLVDAKKALDQAASEMRDVASQIEDAQAPQDAGGGGGTTSRNENGTVVSSQDQGDPQAFSRIGGEGEIIEYDPGYLSGTPLPSEKKSSTSENNQQIGTSQTSTILNSSYYINYIVPYYYPWKWQNVVSKYFRRD